MTKIASLFDLVDDDAKQRAIEEARADIAAGRTVEHAVVVAWLERLAAGERVPPPLSDQEP
jgi:predicted transcriptional regulator